MHESSVFGFVCCCGCFTIVELPLDDYDALDGEVFAPGHTPPAEPPETAAETPAA